MERGDYVNTWLYHDIKRVEHILKKGFDRNDLAVDMKMLCVYYRDVLGYKPKQRKDALEAFCEEHINGYNEVLYFRIIDSALNFAKKKNSRLVEINKIDIYKSEVDYINNLPVEPNFKRILFALLVSIKLHRTMLATIYTAYREGYFTSKRIKDSEIFNIAHVTTNLTKRYYFHMLEMMGYITTYKSGVMNVKIFDNMPIDTSEVAIEIKRFLYAGYYFDAYNNEPLIIYCPKCGVPFRKTNGRHIYCKEHAIEPPVEPREYVCVDCGATYLNKGTFSPRCPECRKIYRRETMRKLSRENMRKYRARKKEEKQIKNNKYSTETQ